MSPYGTVNYLAYRVSVSTSAAGAYSREARALAEDTSRLETRGVSDHHDLLIPEIQAQAARAEAAATRAGEALDRCWAIAHKDPRGPVIRVSDRTCLLYAEDDDTRTMVAEYFGEAQTGRAEAHLALDIIKALRGLVAGFDPARQAGAS